MKCVWITITLSIGLFVGMIGCLEVGYRWGQRRARKADPQEGVAAIDAAVFALLGLLLGFSFAAAASRLEARRELIVQEANAIGTAYLRLDLLPDAARPDLRQLFREYLDTRLGVYQKLPDIGAASAELASAAKIQQRIWSQAVAASRSDPTTAKLLLPAVNEMIEARRDHFGNFVR